MPAKPMFRSLPVYSIGLAILKITNHIKFFVEKMKILFQQKGYVSKGLNAKILVNKVPLSFSA